MTALDPARLADAVWAEDAALVRELLADATEADRRALAKALKSLRDGPRMEPPRIVMSRALPERHGPELADFPLAAKTRPTQPTPPVSERERRDWWTLHKTAAFAAFAVGLAGGMADADRALNECTGHNWNVSDAEAMAVAGVLADRNPPWLAELADARLRAPFHLGFGRWALARWLVRLGAIDRPVAGEYGALMVQGLAQHPPLSGPLPTRSGQQMPHATGTGGDLLARRLRAESSLLQHEVWRLFTDPGVGQAMEGRLGWSQVPVGAQWTDALAELAADDDIDRSRLLDECLDALLRDFPPNHVGWYASLHERLAPDDDELAARTARYLALLAARSKTAVTLGQQTCVTLMEAGLPEAGRLSPDVFLAASGPALLFPLKSVALAQLRLVGKLAAKGSPIRDQALAMAAEAFAHSRDDVQAAALKLIGRHGLLHGAGARATVTALASALSPVLRPDADALGLGAAVPSPLDTTAAAATGPVPVAPVHEPAARVARVADPAELIQLLARLMEDAADTLAVERALAGAVRLAGLPPAERAELAGPLLRRARKQATVDYEGPFSGQAIRADVAWLTLTWGAGEIPPASVGKLLGWDSEGHGTPWQSRPPTILSGILSARIGEACTLIAAGSAVPLLAEPEFADGTISGPELAARQARWAAAGAAPRRYDLEVARLRAASGADAELILEPQFNLPRVGQRYLLSELTSFSEESTGVHAVPAALSTSAAAPHYWALLTTMSHSLDDRRFAVHRTGIRLDEMIASWPLLCPHDPELAAAHLLSPLSDGLGSGRNSAVTAALALPRLTGGFGPIGHLALVAALSGASAEVRITAADGWRQLAAQGRLDPALAAGAIERGVREGPLMLSRIADGLGHAATDPAAALTVAQACLTATAALWR